MPHPPTTTTTTNTTNPSEPRGKHFTNPYLLNNVAAYRHRWRKPPHTLWPHRTMKLCELVPGTCHVVRGTRTPSLCHLPKKEMPRDRIMPFCLMKFNWSELNFFFTIWFYIRAKSCVNYITGKQPAKSIIYICYHAISRSSASYMSSALQSRCQQTKWR